MTRKKVLITDKVHPLLIEGLIVDGFDVLYDISVDNVRLDQVIHEYCGVVINSKIIMDKTRMDKGTQLEFIGRLGSGLEIIDVEYAKKRNIKVYNSPEGNRNAVAEHEVGMILGLMNNIVRSDREVRNFEWHREQNRGVEIKGKTIGIIGLGHTGQSFASKWKNWGVEVVGYDKYKKSYPADLKFVEKIGLKELCFRSDILSLHLPLTNETKYIVDEAFLLQCKKGFIISNTSRGQIIHTPSLINALTEKRVSGACLDVFENEKPDTYSQEEKEMYQQLFSMPNVILSPHIAGWTHESLTLIASVLLGKIRTANISSITT